MEEPGVGRQHLHQGAHGFSKQSALALGHQETGLCSLGLGAIRCWELEQPSSKQTLSL